LNKNIKINNGVDNIPKEKITEKRFFNYKHNIEKLDPDQSNFRRLDNKWDVEAIIKTTDLILDYFINLNNRLKISKGKLFLAKILIKQFEECDSDSNDIIDLKEFKKCIKKQHYFSILSNVHKKHYKRLFTRQNNLKYIYGERNSTELNYLEIIFKILNNTKNKYFSIVEYIKLRFLMLIFRKCQTRSYFISKLEFECIANEFDIEGYTKDHHTMNRIYVFIQSISRFETYNDLDFINALVTLNSIQLFGTVNKAHIKFILYKPDLLDSLAVGKLPQRFNEKNIKMIYSQLGKPPDVPIEGIDLNTFIFIDRFLVIFHENSSELKTLNVNENFVDLKGFINCFKHYLFPDKYFKLFNINLKYYDLEYMKKYERDTDVSYIPFYLRKRVEEDKLILLEKRNLKLNLAKEILQQDQNNRSEETTTTTTRRIIRRKKKIIPKVVESKNDKNTNISESLAPAAIPPKEEGSHNNIYISLPTNFETDLEKFFNILFVKIEDKKLINFPDFLYLIQYMYLYPKLGRKYKWITTKDRLYDFISVYSDYPIISNKFYSRNNQLKYLKQNSLFDFFSSFLFFSYQDLISKAKDMSNEVIEKLSKKEIFQILDRVHIINLPDLIFTKCYIEKENRIIKLEDQYNVNCIFNYCFQYIGQNINNYSFSTYLTHNNIMSGLN